MPSEYRLTRRVQFYETDAAGMATVMEAAVKSPKLSAAAGPEALSISALRSAGSESYLAGFITSAKVAMPFNGKHRRSTRLYARTGLPVSQITGDATGYAPSRCSVKAVTPESGANDGKFHHPGLSGMCVAFHARIAQFRSGSPRSE